MIAPANAIAAIPDEVPAEEAGPFMCAGVTVYNALRHSGARSGDVVAIHGIGGLGHLGVQYARQMGFNTVQRSEWRAPNDRKIPARSCRGSLRTNAQWQGEVPSCADLLM